MEVLTEADLRASIIKPDTTEYCIRPGVFITPLAREFLRDRHIRIVESEEVPARLTAMPRTPIPIQGDYTYVDAVTGKFYEKKPEHMTHLRGNQLVPKTHPRIEFRGKLDTLQAEIILTQVGAHQEGRAALVSDLGQVLSFVREILGAEVAGRPLSPMRLLGLDEAGIHNISHHIRDNFSFDHPVPHYTMGAMAAKLNLLRAKSREAELSGERAFTPEDKREDIMLAMNRLSSAIYILFCRQLAGKYEEAK